MNAEQRTSDNKSDNKNLPLIHVIAVCHQRHGELKVFLQSWINQSSNDWTMTIIHDGPSRDFEKICKFYQKISPCTINFFATDQRYNDYGHTLRDIGLKFQIGEYALLTNGDNYFVPKSVELISKGIRQVCDGKNTKQPDIVLFNMIHSHVNPGGIQGGPYIPFNVEFKKYRIDVSSAIVKHSIASEVGFQDKTHDGDQTYFSQIAQSVDNISVLKINHTLLVHN